MESKRRIRRLRERRELNSRQAADRAMREHEPTHDGKQRHPSESAARTAARILARMHPGQTFSVYSCSVGEAPHWHAGHAPWFVRYRIRA